MTGEDKSILTAVAMVLATIIIVTLIVTTYFTFERRDMLQNGYILDRPMVQGQETWIKKN